MRRVRIVIYFLMFWVYWSLFFVFGFNVKVLVEGVVYKFVGIFSFVGSLMILGLVIFV